MATSKQVNFLFLFIREFTPMQIKLEQSISLVNLVGYWGKNILLILKKMCDDWK